MKDYQRSKVYKWEAEHLYSMDRQIVPFSQIQAIVNWVWEDMGLKFPPIVKVLPKQATTIAGDATRTVVRFQEEGVATRTILHELAHSMTAGIEGKGHQHNEYFVGMYMVLLEKYMKIDMLYLWYTAEKNGVKFEKFMKPRITDEHSKIFYS